MTRKKMRADEIAESYIKHGFKPEIVACGAQMAYEMEMDLRAMKWALDRIIEFLEDAEKHNYFTGTLHIAKDELVKRISTYSCPSNLKDQYKTKDNCPLKKDCKCIA